MNQRMKPYPLYRRGTALNEWNEEEVRWEPAGTIRAAVSTLTTGTREANGLTRVTSTHMALTRAAVRPGDRVGDWRVDGVIPGEGRRLTRLLLSRAVPRG